MRTIGWCMLCLGMVAGAAAAENTAATQTSLTVATDNAGPRTRATLTAHVSGDQAGSLSDEITTADLDAIQTQIPGVAAVAGSRDMPMTVIVNGVERPVTLIGVTPGFRQIRHLIVTRGRYFDGDELQTATQLIPGPVTHVWLTGGDHSLRGRDDVVASIVDSWLAAE